MVKPASSPSTKPGRYSAFAQLGFKNTVEILRTEIRDLYIADSVPWIIGYSGGKDSTAVLQLIWGALSGLPDQNLKKPIHVISTDTLVENPIVAAWVEHSHSNLRVEAINQKLPFEPHRLTPAVVDSFWVNLIGKGYPAPRHMFRWCTERLKIRPSNKFITDLIKESGQAILALGTRKAESATRSASMTRHEAGRTRDRLSPNASLPGSLVYSPIEDWSNDDVWLFLMQEKNPWGFDNSALLTMYQGASPDGECPLVVDATTPSCGDSRFGCWVCTLVEKDKSMSAMIQNDAEKDWMLPLLEFRNELDFRLNGTSADEESSDRHLRDFRRMNGTVQIYNGRPIPGPYTQDARHCWLRKLLGAQTWIRRNGPQEVKTIQLVTLDELQEIRRIWVVEKHELEDTLPNIYLEVTGEAYPGRPLDDNTLLGAEELELLKDVCGDDRIQYELTRELLSTERQQLMAARRSSISEKLEKAITRHYYADPKEAADLAQDKLRRKTKAQTTSVERSP